MGIIERYGNGNATNAEENNSQNQCGILFPIASEVSDTESYLISLIKTSGKEKNYELIEYINDVNREYAEVLVEQNINGADDTTYVYGAVIGNGADRLSADRFDGSTGYYLYDPRGSVTGITNEEGQIYQSYRYSAFGEITFGAPTYENEYTYNGESYNPNIESQYLRARYYDVVTATFITEDFYPQDMWLLWNITEPLTLNRYNYCVSSPLNYVDPSGHAVEDSIVSSVIGDDSIPWTEKVSAINERINFYHTLQYISDPNANFGFVIDYDYEGDRDYLNEVYAKAAEQRWIIEVGMAMVEENRVIDYFCEGEPNAEFNRYYEKYGYVSPEQYLITEEILINIGWEGEINEMSMYSLNMMLVEYEINTTERLRHFFTQILVESNNGLYNREGEQLLTEYGYTQEEYENYYNNSNRSYTYKDRGVGYIQTTFTYNQQAFATYLLINDYTQLEVEFLSPKNHNAEEIEENYQNALEQATNAGIDISMYQIIVDQGTDYIAVNYPWDIAGYWWMVNKENEQVDTFESGNKYEVDKVTDDVNYNLGQESRNVRIEKYEEIMPYIQ